MLTINSLKHLHTPASCWRRIGWTGGRDHRLGGHKHGLRHPSCRPAHAPRQTKTYRLWPGNCQMCSEYHETESPLYWRISTMHTTAGENLPHGRFCCHHCWGTPNRRLQMGAYFLRFRPLDLLGVCAMARYF